MSLLSAYTRFFYWRFSFRNLREYLLVIYLNSFGHKTFFNHRSCKLNMRGTDMAGSGDQVQKYK